MVATALTTVNSVMFTWTLLTILFVCLFDHFKQIMAVYNGILYM